MSASSHKQQPPPTIRSRTRYTNACGENKRTPTTMQSEQKTKVSDDVCLDWLGWRVGDPLFSDGVQKFESS